LTLSTDGFGPPRQKYAREWLAERAEAQLVAQEERQGEEPKRPGSDDEST
jgi:hypothetical protein